jgi:phosphoribosylglycinamide formyltransferase-1
VINVPSDFRTIPKCEVASRGAAKKSYEERVFELMRKFGADVLVSDHYMAKIEFLMNGEFGLYGRMLNIHPAVTALKSPFCVRGATPTADILARAKEQPTWTGATLHLVNEEFDDGPIVHWDAPTPVYASDTPEELRYRNYQMAKLPVFIEGMEKYVNEILPTM